MLRTSQSVARRFAGMVATVGMVAGLAPVALAQGDDLEESVVASRRAAALATRARRVAAPVPTSLQGVNVVGVAWTSDNEPIPNPRLRLRDVVSGGVAASARGNDVGEFVFDELGAGTYLVELVDRSDRVQAVGEVMTVIAGEIVATFVVLSNTAPGIAAIASNAAASAVSAASAAGAPAIAAAPSDISGES